LVAIDYFTKWVEAIPLKVMPSANVIEFIKEHIIYRFGIPQTIMIDQGKLFTSQEFEDFAADTGFKLLNSSSYNAQENGQATMSNQILIKMIKKKIIDAPKKWHLVLNETPWAYRMACHGSTKCSPYELVYEHNVVLPWETRTGSRRVMLQDDLKAGEYKHLIMDNLEDLHCHGLRALENIEANKLRIAKYYDKKVRDKQFHARDLVWKVMLPIGSKDNNYGK
jgi:hypothetical protein